MIDLTADDTPEDHHQQSKQVTRLDSGQVTTWTSWHRWTATSLLVYAFLAVAWQRACDAADGPRVIPVIIPELLRQLHGTAIPEPRRDKPHRDAWLIWRRRHEYQA